jgi:hypothetical protein
MSAKALGFAERTQAIALQHNQRRGFSNTPTTPNPEGVGVASPLTTNPVGVSAA